MKIIVVSDTHGASDSLRRVMELNRDADVVVHCGDSRGELEDIKLDFPDKMYYDVRGNCDFGSNLPLYLTFTLDGLKFMVTHGHAYNVKFGFEALARAAAEEGADIVFYGHTHVADDRVMDGVRLVNPGACGGWGASFAVVETRNGQALVNITSLRKLGRFPGRF